MEPCVPHTSHALLECRGVDRAVLGRLRAAAAWHVSVVTNRFVFTDKEAQDFHRMLRRRGSPAALRFRSLFRSLDSPVFHDHVRYDRRHGALSSPLADREPPP